MTANFLLGIGGTGAKCVEAFTYLAACGLGPSDTWVGLLDQDRSNGNSARAIHLLTDYTALRATLRAAGTLDLGRTCSLLSTVIEKPRSGWAWAPQERSASTLSASVGYPGLPARDQSFMDALFSHEERQLRLDEGFRQRPALGAALTLAGVTPASEFWRDLLEVLQASGHGTEVRVFLVASIFGGTGAAGFPTVARLLREEIRRRHLEDRVKLGGALLLPYFAFPPPPSGDGPAIRPDSTAFMVQARGALEYYAELFRSERVFDRLYVMGSDPLIRLNGYSDGGPTQANPPLLPELLAALAAVDFVSTRPDVDGETVAAGSAAGDVVGWDDLPFEGEGGTVGLRARVAAAVRLAVAWRGTYAPALRGDAWKRCQGEQWFKRLTGAAPGLPVGSDEAQRAIVATQRLLDGFLRWTVALNRLGAGGGRHLALIDDQMLASGSDTATLGDIELTSVQDDATFARIIPPLAGVTLRQVFSQMTYGPAPAGGAGLGRVLAALHTACLNERDGRV